MSYDQTNRILAIRTELGENAAVLTELEGEDAISRPFLFRIRFATEAKPVEVKKLLGTAVTLWMGRPGESDGGPTGLERRPVHGRIRRLTRGVAARGDTTEWQAEVVPMLWFLSRTSDCRIFQDVTVPDIIKKILDLHGVTDYAFMLTGTYKPLEYCVQYRESALDFISRLMEQAGIFYWHEHSESGHKLVIADENGSAPLAPFPKLPISGPSGTAAIHRLDEEFTVRSGKWTLRDYNFETPTLDLEVNAPTTIEVEQMQMRERYDYPGLYADAGAGRDVAEILMEQEEAHFHRRHGQSGIAGLNAGLRIRIADIDDPEVLVTEVRHRAEDYSHWSGEMWGNRQPRAPFYENSFVCIPKRVPFRAERVTPKPFVRGPQTAVVTGPAGEEIHTDKYGRVKVRFHWDRVNPADDTSSCWVRVSQGWAGAGWGQIHIPRVGHEVIVDFLEGDPDRPIITGRVYNAQNKVPYALPANKTQSGIKSNSTKGGGGSNEFRFEDKKGSEEIYLHAEKDLNSVIENNETRKVGGKGTGNRTTEIKNDETTQIGGNKKTTVNGNFDETVFGKESRMVLETVTENFGADETRTIAGNQSETIGGNVTQTVAGSLSQTVASGIQITTPSTVTITATGGWTLVAPAGTRTIESFFDSTGIKNADAFQFKFSLATSSIDIVSLALSVNTSLKVDLANFKIDKTAVELLKKDVETKNVTTNMNVMNIQIKMINVYLIN